MNRERELAQLATFSHSTRLVTLLGPAGVGKTRLALEAWPAALVVELAGAEGEEGVISAFCRALSIENVGRQATDVIREALLARAPREVVLDGCDRARPAIATFASALLGGSRDLFFVCTSRSALDLPFEQRFHVEPLLEADAARLFVDRARLVDPSIAIDPQDELLRSVLGALGGFPLAIELVAAQVAALGLEGIARRLPHESALEPLRSVIETTTASLSPEGLAALLSLSVFAGSFSLEDAEALVQGDLAPLLRALVDASLLQSRGTARRRRFELYAPVRAFAREALGRRPELEPRALAAHRALVLRKLEPLTEDPIGALESALAIEQLLPELQVADRTASPAESVRMIAALEQVVIFRGALPDLAAWVAEGVALAREADVEPGLRARLCSLHALVQQRRGFVESSIAHHLEAGFYALGAPDVLPLVWSRWLVALVVWGRIEEAYEVAQTLLHNVREPHARAVARMERAISLLLAGREVDDALAEIRHSLLELDRLGDRRLVFMGQANLALSLVYLGRLEQARRAFEDLAAGGFGEEADAHTRVSTVANHALLLHELALGDPDTIARADELYQKAIAGFARMGAKPYAGLVRAHHAMLLFERGDRADAEAAALSALRDQPDPNTSALAHAELASMRAAAGALDDAHTLLREARILAASGNKNVLHCIELHEEYVGLQERVGVRTREDRARLRSRLERYSSLDIGGYSPRVRNAARLLARALDETPSVRSLERTDWIGALVVGRDAAWLRAPTGEQADLSQRPKLRALMRHLLRRHEEARGRPVPPSELISEVWPDERFVANAGKTRLHTLVFTLRSLGLRDVVQSTSSGYCLDPTLNVVQAEF